MKRFAIWFVSLIVIASALPTAAQFTFDDMLSQKRVSDPQLSPDGRYVIYNVGVVNKAENRVLTQIFRSAVDGSEIKQLTEGNTSNSSGRWSMDGKYIAYNTGGQIWVMNADGSGKRQVTKYPTGASGPVWSPDGKWLLFRSDVYPECTTEECNTSEEEKAKNSKVQAKITEPV
ncbi:TolB family protein [Leptolyngbya sp. 7M]|uniref:TolB family protein n=1 Tax=Leptolyngbya sp. 7M TaxID=2812896 RepID=UPI001B8D6F49|nr:PD40 domain-containing protein [Leptolyngbya sp. 7M]QYO64728.1 PD40 domain-containing protein [Leptolyngbya sp. 7M]